MNKKIYPVKSSSDEVSSKSGQFNRVKIEIAVGVILIIAIIIGGAVWLENKKTNPPIVQNPVVPVQPTGPQVCTQETKLCPDGQTYVSRSGPNCEFKPCP